MQRRGSVLLLRSISTPAFLEEELMKKAKNDALSMVVLMLFSASFYFYFIPTQVPAVKNSKTFFTSQTFPRFTMAVIFLLALCGLVNALLRMKKLSAAEPKAEKKPKTKEEIWLMLAPYAAFLLILGYALVFKYVGFVVATVLFVPLFLILLRCKKWQYYVGAYVFCAVMYLIFTNILNVRLS